MVRLTLRTHSFLTQPQPALILHLNIVRPRPCGWLLQVDGKNRRLVALSFLALTRPSRFLPTRSCLPGSLRASFLPSFFVNPSEWPLNHRLLIHAKATARPCGAFNRARWGSGGSLFFFYYSSRLFFSVPQRPYGNFVGCVLLVPPGRRFAGVSRR